MATKSNLVIDQGATYSVTLNLTDENGDPLDLTGFTANAMMRRWYTSLNSIVFNTSINASAGTITLELDANVTISLSPGRYVYDVDITNSDVVSRVVEGIVLVTPTATK